MKKKIVDKSTDVFILIASGFDERLVNICVGDMREAGIGVAIVGLSLEITNSLHGVAIQPDQSLGFINPVKRRTLIILPGGDLCIASLALDPRVHRLIAQSLQSGGHIAIANSAESHAREVMLPTTSKDQIITQKTVSNQEFVNALISQLRR